MGKMFYQFKASLLQPLHSVISLVLIFGSLVIVFGILTTYKPDVWIQFLPILLLGLSYAMISLSLDQLFREDLEDGTLEWRMSESQSLETYIFIKILTHWTRITGPIIILIGIVTGFSSQELLIAIATTTLCLTLVGAIGSALCLAAKSNASFILPIIIFPLGIPMMLVGMSAIQDPQAVQSSYHPLQAGLLLTSAAVSFAACPFALRLALR
jgi:heme exporter protein B